MSGTFKWGLVAVCLLALGVGHPDRAEAQGTPKRGGTALVGVSVAGATLNTQLTSAVTPLIIADLWASGLYKYDKTGAKKPQIASSWEISKDGKVYTFHLRPNLKWSDGHAFSSEDVAFTLKAFAQYNTYLVKVQPNLDRIETPDANTFVVHLKEPQSSALEGFDKEVFPLMPKHIYDGTDIPTNPANRAPVGMGPFRFVKWEEGRGITFERNEYYWDQPRPYLDSVVAVFIPNVQQQQNALYRGEIDVLRPALPQVGRTIEQAKAKGAFEVREIKVNAAERLSLDMNITRDVLSKALVRQALLTAIDRERISKDVYQGLAFPAMNAIPEQFTMLTDPSVDYNKQFAYDPAKAGKMLDRHRGEAEPARRPAVDQQGLQGARLRRLDGLADGPHRSRVRRRPLVPMQYGQRAVRQSDWLLQSRARRDRRQGGGRADGRTPAVVQEIRGDHRSRHATSDADQRQEVLRCFESLRRHR